MGWVEMDGTPAQVSTVQIRVLGGVDRALVETRVGPSPKVPDRTNIVT